MLCSKEDRISFMASGHCPDCGGCIDDECRGCKLRWCGGTYEAWAWMYHYERPENPCNRCPEKIDKVIDGGERLIRVRCNGDTGHTGQHHWHLDKVGK